MSILLTGFEPFGPHRENSSARVVESLAGVDIPGQSLHTAILPVTDEGGPAALIRVVEEQRPDAVLCLGQAARRVAISIEQVAINLKSYEMPDNDGRAIVDAPVVPHGLAAYFTTLPARAIHTVMRARGIPAELSRDAGAFICNQVLYTLLHHVAATPAPPRCGFVHLPLLSQQAAIEPRPVASMDLETMRRAIMTALEVIAGEDARARLA